MRVKRSLSNYIVGRHEYSAINSRRVLEGWAFGNDRRYWGRRSMVAGYIRRRIDRNFGETRSKDQKRIYRAVALVGDNYSNNNIVWVWNHNCVRWHLSLLFYGVKVGGVGVMRYNYRYLLSGEPVKRRDDMDSSLRSSPSQAAAFPKSKLQPFFIVLRSKVRGGGGDEV